MDMTLLDWARLYTDLGLVVVPLKIGTKQPAIDWKPYQERKPTNDDIERWFGTGLGGTERAAGIGCLTGKASNIIVLDVDAGHGGFYSIDRLKPLPICARSRTGGGGAHLFFRYPAGYNEIRNFAGKLPGLDLRGDGGFVVLPPSRHPVTGLSYIWQVMISPATLHEPPEHIIKFICMKVSNSLTTKQGGNYGPAFPNGELAELLNGVGEGKRNDAVARLAGRLIGKGLTDDEVQIFLLAWNKRNQPPLDDDELLATIESIRRTHERSTNHITV